MRPSFLIIIFFLILACSCNERDQDRIVRGFTIDPTLAKATNDTFKIGRNAVLRGLPSYFFKDSNGYCKLQDDTIKIFLQEINLTSTLMDLFITKQTFYADVWIDGCYFSIHYKPIMPTLKLNKETFHIGDTIIGDLDYRGLPLFGDSSLGTDTLSVKGKFKFLVRPENFTFDDLTKEKKYNDFVAL